jgi:hypothetical protein
MKKRWIAVLLVFIFAFTMQFDTRAEIGDLGADWEYDTFGANIMFAHESGKNQGNYTLGDDFTFYTDTYCSGAKGKQGERELKVTAYKGTSPSGIQSVLYKDKADKQYKDISGYNTKITFANSVDQYFKVVFVKEGTYVISSAFLSDDHTVYVACRTRYVTIKDGNYEISFDAPEVPDEEGTFIEGYQISVASEGFRVVAGAQAEVDGKQVVKKGIIFGLDRLRGISSTGITDDDLTVDSENEYVYPVEAISQAAITLNGSSATADYYAMTMKFGAKTYSAFTSVYAVRSYVELEDGTIVYGTVHRFSVFDIAKKLYEGSLMYSKEAHDYLYETVLSLVSPAYEEKEYLDNKGIVPPDLDEEGV